MAIPRGTLMAQNDGTNLYVGLDLTAETGAANPNDYFWFIVDINDNGVIDSNRDKMFSDWPGSPNRLGMWYMAGPDATWPAPNTQVIPSKRHERLRGLNEFRHQSPAMADLLRTLRFGNYH